MTTLHFRYPLFVHYKISWQGSMKQYQTWVLDSPDVDTVDRL